MVEGERDAGIQRDEERNGKGGRETFRRQGMGRKMGGTEMGEGRTGWEKEED